MISNLNGVVYRCKTLALLNRLQNRNERLGIDYVQILLKSTLLNSGFQGNLEGICGILVVGYG